MVLSLFKSVTVLAAVSRLAGAVTLDVTSAASIKNASAAIAKSIIGRYNEYQRTASSTEIGTFGRPYYWWEGAVVWGALIDYRTYTGDTTYDANVTQALLAQVGENKDYLPAAQTKDEGNDDQAFWALACLDALEYGYPASSNASWLDLAAKVWNEQAARWDTQTCGGGLRWQIYSFNVGYNYKNVESNGAFFQLSARLARYTGNQTYATWAGRTYDWMQSTGLVTGDGNIYDGTDSVMNCSQVNHIQWTLNSGLILYGSAVLYNTTGSSTWRDRTQAVFSVGEKIFFTNGSQIMTESACESNGNCNTDQLAFKSVYARSLVKSSIVAPFLNSAVSPLLSKSASAAAASCGDDGSQCSSVWSNQANGSSSSAGGVGQEVSSLSVVQALLAINGTGKFSPLQQGNSSSNSTPSSSAGPSATSTPVRQTGAAARYMPGSIATVIVMICLFMTVL